MSMVPNGPNDADRREPAVTATERTAEALLAILPQRQGSHA